MAIAKPSNPATGKLNIVGICAGENTVRIDEPIISDAIKMAAIKRLTVVSTFLSPTL